MPISSLIRRNFLLLVNQEVGRRQLDVLSSVWMIQVLEKLFMMVARSTEKTLIVKNQSWSVKFKWSSKTQQVWMNVQQLIILSLKVWSITICLTVKKNVGKKSKNIMHEVGLLAEHLTRYPTNSQVDNVNGSVLPVHLLWNQEFVIADEPISALDVSGTCAGLEPFEKNSKEN